MNEPLKNLYLARKFRPIQTYESWLLQNNDVVTELYKDYTSMEGTAISLRDYGYEIYTMYQYRMICSPDSVSIETELNRKPEFKELCRQ